VDRRLKGAGAECDCTVGQKPPEAIVNPEMPAMKGSEERAIFLLA
jgi:hypothetical protein